MGETSMDAQKVNYEQVARKVCQEVGYNAEEKGLDFKTMMVLVNVEPQSCEIANAVHE